MDEYREEGKIAEKILNASIIQLASNFQKKKWII